VGLAQFDDRIGREVPIFSPSQRWPYCNTNTFAIPNPHANAYTKLNARVTSLRFFESGYDMLPREERVYAQRFASGTTRCINWELNLEYPAPGRRIDFQITAINLRDNGTPLWEEIRRQTMDAHVEATWTRSYHWWGYGWPDPGNWESGSYRVDLYVEGKKIASAPFEITASAM
jgi:hypothetical protein